MHVLVMASKAVHHALQPSPPTLLPSSQISPASSLPFPQRGSSSFSGADIRVSQHSWAKVFGTIIAAVNTTIITIINTVLNFIVIIIG